MGKSEVRLGTVQNNMYSLCRIFLNSSLVISHVLKIQAVLCCRLDFYTHRRGKEIYRLLFGFYNFLNRCNPTCKGRRGYHLSVAKFLLIRCVLFVFLVDCCKHFCVGRKMTAHKGLQGIKVHISLRNRLEKICNCTVKWDI